MSNAVVYALDIGVYHVGVSGQILSKSKAAWCRLDAGIDDTSGLSYERTSSGGQLTAKHDGSVKAVFGRSIPDLANMIARDLKKIGVRVSLGFEAPMWLPLEHEHRPRLNLFEHRFDAEKEQHCHWYLQSGAAATLKAIALGIMLREYLIPKVDGLSLTTDRTKWEPNRLVLFEAFVVGDYKLTIRPRSMESRDDEWDALVACLAWGAQFHAFPKPPSTTPRLLHEAGGRRGQCMSVWDVVFGSNTDAITGPTDCDVVALSSTARGSQTAG